MSLNDRIREARKNKGMTQEQLGELIGVAKTTIAGYEKNREPTAAKVGEIADILDVDVNFLFQDEMKKSSTPAKAEAEDLNAEEQQLLEDYRQLNPDGQQVALDYMDGLTYNPKYKKYDKCKNMDADA